MDTERKILVRYLTHIELVCRDFEAAWKSDFIKDREMDVIDSMAGSHYGSYPALTLAIMRGVYPNVP